VPTALETVKESNKIAKITFRFFKMGRFTSQNGPFCSAKRFILRDETAHFDAQNESF